MSSNSTKAVITSRHGVPGRRAASRENFPPLPGEERRGKRDRRSRRREGPRRGFLLAVQLLEDFFRQPCREPDILRKIAADVAVLARFLEGDAVGLVHIALEEWFPLEQGDRRADARRPLLRAVLRRVGGQFPILPHL